MNGFFSQVLLNKWGIYLTVGNVAITLGILLLVIVLDFLLIRAVLRSKWIKQLIAEPQTRKIVRRSIRSTLYILGTILALRFAGFDILGASLYTIDLEKGKGIRGIHVLGAVLVVAITRFSVWYIHRLLVHKPRALQSVDSGRRMALFQIIKYVLYVLATLLILSSLQINLNVIVASSAALFVGVGLALQNVFSDIASGIFILFEGTIEVGDMVVLDSLNLEGKVIEIRLRTSIIETLDSVSVIVPNSKFTTTNVVNWSFNDKETRFRLNIGVAYGSNTQLVRKVLRECAGAHNKVLKNPPPKVRFIDFGESSLDFELLFWLHEVHEYEDIMSDLRFKIDAEFRRHHITIPFPQRDIHIIPSGENSPKIDDKKP
ncbi:MAG: mechanosensitive ion channel domain-containing protein [Bacteroidota bacterium]